jgi:hypothetical protein
MQSFPGDKHYSRPEECNFVCPTKDCKALPFRTKAELAAHVHETLHNLLHLPESYTDKVSTKEGTVEAGYYSPDFLWESLRKLGLMARPITSIPDPRRRGKVPHAIDAYIYPNKRYQCRECNLVAFEWLQLKHHLEQRQHCVMRCEDCNEALDWDPASPNSPQNHARAHALENDGTSRKLHVGIRGVYRDHTDFVATDSAPVLRRQYSLGTGKDMVTYPHKLFHAFALFVIRGQQAVNIDAERSSAAPVTATCINCRDCVRAPLLDACLHFLRQGHDAFIVKHYPEQLHAMPREFEQPPPPPVLMYQCPTCFALRDTWQGLTDHMHYNWHGSVACSACKQRIPAGIAVEHFKRGRCAELNAYHCGGALLTPQRTLVAVDVTDRHQVELIGQSDELIEPCYAQDNNCRIVYQCPLETCLRAYGNTEVVKAHLHTSKHGVYTCNVAGCNQQMCVWEEDFHRHPHPIEIPEGGHLQGKRHLRDFYTMVMDRDALKMWPNNFRLCNHCEMVVEPEEVPRHYNEGECQLRKILKSLNIRETIINLSTNNSSGRVLLNRSAVNDHMKRTER